VRRGVVESVVGDKHRGGLRGLTMGKAKAVSRCAPHRSPEPGGFRERLVVPTTAGSGEAFGVRACSAALAFGPRAQAMQDHTLSRSEPGGTCEARSVRRGVDEAGVWVSLLGATSIGAGYAGQRCVKPKRCLAALPTAVQNLAGFGR
jgi:hypothetical protein